MNSRTRANPIGAASTRAECARCGVLLLAAGFSRRMGQCKLLLDWGGATVLAHLVRLWQSLGAAQVAVALGGDPAVAEELRRLGFSERQWIRNEAPEGGMFSSIRAGARWDGWRSDLSHFIIALGDQPHLKNETCQQLMQVAAAHPGKIWQPSWGGHRCHPVLLPAANFYEIKTAAERDLRSFLAARDGLREFIEMDDAGLGMDMDTPEEYAACLRRAGLPL